MSVEQVDAVDLLLIVVIDHVSKVPAQQDVAPVDGRYSSVEGVVLRHGHYFKIFVCQAHARRREH